MLCWIFFTLNNQFRCALHSAQIIFRFDRVISTVLGPDFEDHQGADPAGVGDVVVGVGVEADVVPVPGDIGSGISRHCTTHVALVLLWAVVRF